MHTALLLVSSALSALAQPGWTAPPRPGPSGSDPWGPSPSSSAPWGRPPGGYGPPQTHNSSFTPDYVLRVTYGNVSIGCESRASVLVNGSTPGLELRLKPGQTSWVRVYNDMTQYNTTMHWHGLSQRTAQFSDGTPSASQWPIAPLHFFDYEIHPELNDSGTYFYHSHVGFQAVSATGPLIIEDNGPPPYAYDEERIVQFTDYFNKTDSTIEKGLVATPFTWSGETNAVLINGVGVSLGEKAGTNGCQLPVIDVEASKIYRMRFIGSTALSMVRLAIVGHDNLTIVAADGQYTQPYQESYMQVSTGQRFDVIFRTKSAQELGSQTDFVIQFVSADRPSIYTGYGVLRYGGGNAVVTTAPTTPPFNLTKPSYAWLEYALQPLWPNDFPTADQVTRQVVIYDRQVLTHTDIWRLNGDQWNDTSPPYPGDTPYLVNIYENGQSAIPNYEAALNNSGWDPYTLTWPAKIGEVLEIIWYNTGSLVQNNGGVDYHPFHAHGAHYYDIGSGNGTYDAAANEKKLANYNPVLRDTTNLYRYETATTAGATAGWRGWRLRVTDPGVWMIHCHILQHMIMGMQTVWVMGDYDQIAAIPHFDAAGYLQYGGDAYGNETFAPRYVHQYD